MKFNSDFDITYNTLSKLTEEIDVNASKKFFNTLKQGLIDIDSFHKAFDDDIKAFGLDSIFGSDGLIFSRNFYGKIKEAADAHVGETNFAIIALKKLWAAQFKDGLLTIAEKEKRDQQEEDRRLAKEKAEQEKVAKEERNKEALKSASLKVQQLLDKDLYDEYKSLIKDPKLAIVRLYNSIWDKDPDNIKVMATFEKPDNAKDDPTNISGYWYGEDIPVVEGIVTDEQIKQFVDMLNKKLPELITKLKNYNLERTIVDKFADIFASGDGIYYFMSGSDLYTVAYKNSKIKSIYSKSAGKDIDLADFPADVELVATELGLEEHTGRCYYSYYASISFNSKKYYPEKWHEHDDEIPVGSYFKSADPADAAVREKFVTGYGFDKWGRYSYWSDSSD